LPVNRRNHQLPTNQPSDQTTSEIPPALHQKAQHTKEALGLNTSSRFPQKLSDKEGQHPLTHSPAHQPILRRDKDPENASVKSISSWIQSYRNKSRAFPELIFLKFILFFPIFIEYFLSFFCTTTHCYLSLASLFKYQSSWPSLAPLSSLCPNYFFYCFLPCFLPFSTFSLPLPTFHPTAPTLSTPTTC
jgi:hypothetical protein